MANGTSGSNPSSGLRQLVMKGGVYLAIRQGLGFIIGVLGPLFLLRAVGPGPYGVYSAAAAIVFYAQLVSQWGVEIFLMRHEEFEDCPEVYHQAFTILTILSVLAVLVMFLTSPLIDKWMRLPGFATVERIMFLSLPVLLLSQVPLARLERRLDYKRVSIVELLGQVIYYLVALPLAFHGRGVWALVVGWWCQRGLIMGVYYAIDGYRPSFHFDWDLSKRILSYGLGYSTSTWVYQLRVLVNPLVVGRYAGADAVGYVALAIRLAEALSFAKSAAWRISIAALAKVQRDRPRLIKSINEGMRLQTLLVGPPLVAFSVAGSYLLPLFYGPRWENALVVYPYIALATLTNGLFTLHASALYVLKKNWRVTAFSIVHVLLFAGFAFFFVVRDSMVGYGWAEAVAILSYPILHYELAKEVGEPDYRLVALWYLAFAFALFEVQIGWVSLLGILLVALLPATWRQLRIYLQDVRAAARSA